ncbi:hypothetical protein ACFX10_024669 [Malus domestica]
MTNISRSPFKDKIEQAEPPREFSMPHFTYFKRDEDPERHLKHYRSAMILYQNNDDLKCKIFATTLQEYSSYRSVKKKSDHLFDVKKNPKESLRDYVRRFKVEKAKIVGYSFALAEKHALWDEVRRCPFKANSSDLEYEVPHYSEGDSKSD